MAAAAAYFLANSIAATFFAAASFSAATVAYFLTNAIAAAFFAAASF
jgi:hypothetical protein